eukprot:scaffold2176_cov30-Tisochrysis_lutea.AAC.1
MRPRKESIDFEVEASAAKTNVDCSRVRSSAFRLDGKYSRIWMRPSTAVWPYCVATATWGRPTQCDKSAMAAASNRGRADSGAHGRIQGPAVSRLCLFAGEFTRPLASCAVAGILVCGASLLSPFIYSAAALACGPCSRERRALRRAHLGGGGRHLA